jgi:hypothetical protein
MKLKLDENLAHATADLSRLGGHDVEMVRGEGLSGASDADIIAACQREERCLITLDSDFGNPLVFQTLGVFWDRRFASAFQTLASRSAICLSNACSRTGTR